MCPKFFIFLYFVILIDGACIISNLSIPRYNPTATSVGKMVLFAGGWNDNAISIVDMLNTSSNSWTSHHLETNPGFMTSASVVDVAFFNGGTVLDVYNATSNTWYTTSLSVQRYNEAVASSGNYAIWAGGLSTAEGQLTSVVEIFTYSGIGTGTWKTASLSEARYKMAATAVGNYFLFAGGHNGTTSVKTVEIYNTETNSWSMTNLPEERWAATGTFYAISAGGLAFFTGYTQIVDVFNPSTFLWTTAQSSTTK